MIRHLKLRLLQMLMAHFAARPVLTQYCVFNLRCLSFKNSRCKSFWFHLVRNLVVLLQMIEVNITKYMTMVVWSEGTFHALIRFSTMRVYPSIYWGRKPTPYCGCMPEFNLIICRSDRQSQILFTLRGCFATFTVWM